jgi:hypothetical protein
MAIASTMNNTTSIVGSCLMVGLCLIVFFIYLVLLQDITGALVKIFILGNRQIFFIESCSFRDEAFSKFDDRRYFCHGKKKPHLPMQLDANRLYA